MASRPGRADLIVRGRRVITPDGCRPAAVHIRDGRIAAVTGYDELGELGELGEPGDRGGAGGRGGPGEQGSQGGRGAQADVEGLAADEVLLPGLVDTHVHVNEPGRTHWEGFRTATLAAAAGGVTTIVDMPLNSIPPVTDAAALDAKQRAAHGQCHVDVGFWGGAVPGNEAARPALHDAGVFGFKCFTIDSGVPEFRPLDEAGLAAALRQTAGLGSLLIVHAEDACCIAGAPAPDGTSYAGFLASRPAAAEITAVARVIELARAAGGRAHVLHLSGAAAVPVLAAARAEGVRVSAETCPHYLALAAQDIPDGATQFKCCPPIRDRANADRLWQALADGVIDCVVSDHSPCPPELKDLRRGDFGLAWGGIASVQLGLPVVWTQARARGHQLEDIARWMSAAPAQLAGMPAKGAIAAGRDADLVAFAPDEQFTVRPDRLLTRHQLTPYAGRALSGVVRRTWLRGAPVGADKPQGRLLIRGGTGT